VPANTDTNALYRNAGLLTSFLIAACAFAFVTGGLILFPLNTAWIDFAGDPFQHWISWEFFREAPLLQWPLGMNPRFGGEAAGSIVFTDSIPLLAFLFKPFSAWLPTPFQYLGLWVCACFILQAYFAYRLLSLITENTAVRVLASCFFVFAPPMIIRLYGHYALFSHWLIIAALYFYFSPAFRVRSWLLLIALALLIHPYFFPMLLVLWLADLTRRLWSRQLPVRSGAVHALAAGSVWLLTMWTAGYFVGGGFEDSGGYGFYRLNLLSLFDQRGGYSSILPPIGKDMETVSNSAYAVGAWGDGGDYEGFAYLGLGMILLLPVALLLLFRDTKMLTGAARIIPLTLALTGLTIFAVSNNIALGTQELFSFNLPWGWASIATVFRSSGRFVWPLFYALYLLVFYILIRAMPAKRLAPLLFVALLVFLLDSSPAYSFFRSQYRPSGSHADVLASPLWQDLGTQYKHIVYVLPEARTANWRNITYFAWRNGLDVNSGYYARADQQKILQSREKVAAAVEKGRWDRESLYVFNSDELWQQGQKVLSTGDWTGTVDGYHLVAPGLMFCASCEHVGRYADRLTANLPETKEGAVVAP